MNSIHYKIQSFNDQAIYISFGNCISKEFLQIIRTVLAALSRNKPNGFIEAVPGYNNITVYYDPIKVFKENRTQNVQASFIHEIENLLNQIEMIQSNEPNIIQLPVCYDQSFGHDLAFVAENNQLTIDEVIRIHSAAKYTVHMLGFSPGFPYLGGMPAQIAAPRKTTPAFEIPAGSVGIAGKQTGIYPVATPGGWQIIGRTPISLFDLKKNPPSLLNAGDIIQFYPISLDEFKDMEEFSNDLSS